MNIDLSIVPLIAVIAYIPLLIMVIGSGFKKRANIIFLIFLVSAMLWSLTNYIFRSNMFPEYSSLVFKLVIAGYLAMSVLFHHFLTFYYPSTKGRWLGFAYAMFAVLLIPLLLGYFTDVNIANGIIHGSYKIGIVFYILFVIVLAFRNYYVFILRLKATHSNPEQYNYILYLLLGLSGLVIFSVISILPLIREIPMSHVGNLLNALMLTVAVVRHNLIDIRLVVRHAVGWLFLGIIGVLFYWIMLIVFSKIFVFQMDLVASLVATFVSLIVAIFIYNIRNRLFDLTNRAFQGKAYDYRQRLYDFTGQIHNVFSLKEQGGELLSLLVRSVRARQAGLLFPEVGTEYLSTQFVEPAEKDNPVHDYKIRVSNPIIRYLEHNKRILMKDSIATLPSFLGMWPQEKEEIESHSVEIFVPLISRDRLIAILVLGKKYHGKYSLEDVNIIENVTNRVAVSLEKEYLREQLREKEEELSVINNSSAIVSSSLDITEIFGSFVDELKKVIDVSWASIILKDDDILRCVAISSKEQSAFKIGDVIPSENTGSGWVIAHKKVFIEPDLEKDHCFQTADHFLEYGLRSMVYLPLIAKGNAIGSFIVASSQPYRYTQRHVKLLEQLAAQIALPLENTRIYAKAEQKARVDELTALLNRRSLDEMLDAEISRHSRYGGVFTIAIIDLDSFKAYNDTYGHLSGDNLLRDIGVAIKSAVRTADRSFRYGGDEFAIVMPQTDIESAYIVAERVRRKIATIDTGPIRVTASIGIATWPEDGISNADIIKAADTILYRSKKAGGNQTLYSNSASLAVEQLAEAIAVNVEQDHEGVFDMIMKLTDIVDVYGYSSIGHSKKVTDYAIKLAHALKMTPEDVRDIEICGMLHDVGKLSISRKVLNKTGTLSGEEMTEMKRHPQLGADIVDNILGTPHCAEMILHHHEWYDGSGYPDGLKGEEISLSARILALAEAFAAMTSERPYARALPHTKALEELKKSSGTQFDPALVKQFSALYKRQKDNQKDTQEEGIPVQIGRERPAGNK